MVLRVVRRILWSVGAQRFPCTLLFSSTPPHGSGLDASPRAQAVAPVRGRRQLLVPIHPPSTTTDLPPRSLGRYILCSTPPVLPALTEYGVLAQWDLPGARRTATTSPYLPRNNPSPAPPRPFTMYTRLTLLTPACTIQPRIGFSLFYFLCVVLGSFFKQDKVIDITCHFAILNLNFGGK